MESVFGFLVLIIAIIVIGFFVGGALGNLFLDETECSRDCTAKVGTRTVLGKWFIEGWCKGMCRLGVKFGP